MVTLYEKPSLTVLILPALTTLTFAQDVLTNKSVINLSTAELSSGIIINKIKSSRCSFDLSTDALVAFKQNKVADDVINAMLGKQSSSAETGNTMLTVSSQNWDNLIFTFSTRLTPAM